MQESPPNHTQVERWPMSTGFGGGRSVFIITLLLFVFFFLGFIPPALIEAKVEAAASFPFQGTLDFKENKFSFSVTSANKDALSVNVSKSSESQYNLLINIDHLKTPIFDISSVLECPLEITYDAQKKFHGLSGKLWSKYTLINYQPVRELTGQFEVKDRTLFINSLTVGSLSGQGAVTFAKPYLFNLVLKLVDIDIRNFLNFWIKDNSGLASGQLSGQLVLNGTLKRLQVKGNFVGYEGKIKNSAFENLTINFEGVYPTVTMVNSTGIKPGGLPFSINGNIDLSNRADFVKQVRALSKQAIVQEEGENLEWTLKRMKSDQSSATTELKYMKKKGKGDTGMTPDEDAMLGVERSIQF